MRDSKDHDSEYTDEDLGLGRSVTRRDFLNGVALTVGAAMLPAYSFGAFDAADAEKSPDYYPPALTGLRGIHPVSFDAAHSLRDGTFLDKAGKPTETGEVYDLVVVGAGISGLSAAHYFRKLAGSKARVLILDNHDDFGGHAKRNEFRSGNRTLLGYGGVFSIESPAPYSAVAKGLISELGIDVSSYSKYLGKDVFRAQGLGPKIFFDKENFGADKLVTATNFWGATENDDVEDVSPDAWKEFLAEAPLCAEAKRDYQRLYQGEKDYLPGLTSDEKKARLARISYAKFLGELAGISDEVIRLHQTLPHTWFGVGIDAVSAQDAWGLGYPGFDGMNLDSAPGRGMSRDAIPNEEAKNFFFHFPDGNATIARLLVRRLVPDAIPGNSVTDVITAKANYAKLYDTPSTVRISLNSTAVRVKHLGDPASAKEVEIAYARGGGLHTVRTAHCIMACWHVVIPYVCEELPDRQKDALSSAAKVPLLYTNVAIRNWSTFQKLKAGSIYAPGCYHSSILPDLPVSIGDYQSPRQPDEPIVVHMMKTPCKPGKPARDQHRLGRMELFSTKFETIERNIREQMARTLSGGGFDPARDITAITVNRWPHGYAYEYNSLWDPFWLEGGVLPCEVARKPFGRIAIANSDAGAYAYTDGAIDQAWRAVGEIVKGVSR